jgi:voltage-gated potassium channel Kch
MNSKSILILGAGHLASRVKILVAEKGYAVNQISDQFSNQPESSTIDSIQAGLCEIDLGSIKLCYVLYENDEDNLETVVALMALYSDLDIHTSLFNDNIIPHLEAANSRLHILNPARIAAPLFLNSLDYNVDSNLLSTASVAVSKIASSRKDAMLKGLIMSFVAVILSATAYFHFEEGLTWLDALYFVVVTVSTVGYGDINLQSASALSKVVGITLILSSTIFIWLIFSLLIDRIIKNRVQRLLGRKKYKYKNHIILCGLGRLGYFIAQELLKQGEKLVIVELDENSANSDHFRSLKIDVYNGNAKLPKVLQDVGVENCKALISVISDDYVNLEVALNARYFQPNIQLVLRIFEESMAKVIKDKFHIHQTQSMSYIAAQEFATILDSSKNLYG